MSRGRGRPAKREGGLTKPYSFKLHAEEARVLDARIAAANMNAADFLRQCVLTNRTTVVAAEPPSLEKIRMQFVVNKAGNNLNQVAHTLNTARLAGRLTDTAYNNALHDLSAIASYLKLFLRDAH